MKTAQDIFNEKQAALARPRLDKVAAWADKGLGPTEIAKLLGITTQRAFQLIRRAKKMGLTKS